MSTPAPPRIPATRVRTHARARVATPPATHSTDDYVRFCAGVKAIAGLDLLQYKRGQMERRVRTFAQRQGTPDLTDYLALLRGDATRLESFLDRVTINVSQLWRNPEQWATLGKHVIPQLARRGRIRVWSAGCSYGAECYTIAAVCLEHAQGARVEVKGTDIDPRVLDRARAGLFSEEDARTAPVESLRRWFEPAEVGWRANEELRGVVKFERGDLLSMAVPTGAYDLVMCRNVVIYFTEDVRDALHERLAKSLRSDGFLVVGSTERVSTASALGLETTHPFTYRKA